MQWESPRCNFCGSNEKDVYLTTPHKCWYGRRLRLVECKRCHLVYADPRPTFDSLMSEYFTEEYLRQAYWRKLNRPNVRTIHRSIVKRALGYCPDAKTLFDVGTGAGTLLLEARQLGLQVAGNDINWVAVNYLQQQGLQVYCSPTSQLQLDAEFDIITCLDYIEHTYTPWDDLQWIYEHLADSGILYLKTLWLGCPDHKEAGARWKLFAELHNYYYTPEVLFEMLRKAGFELLWERRDRAIIHTISRKVRA